MTTLLGILVAIVAALAVIDLRRWIPWLAERIVGAAARSFDQRNRRIKNEEYRANLRYAASPISMLVLAIYTFIKAPFRARELRGGAREAETSIAAQAPGPASLPSRAWESDSHRSAAEYDAWYLARSSAIFTQERERLIESAAEVLRATSDLRRLDPDSLIAWPEALAIACACTCPPMRSKLLTGTSAARSRLVRQLERGVSPDDTPEVRADVQTVCDLLVPQFDRRLLCWLDGDRTPTNDEREHALLTIGERLAQRAHIPRLRTAHDTRQQHSLRAYLESNGFATSSESLFEMCPGSCSFNRRVALGDSPPPLFRTVDCVIAPLDRELPLVIVESLSSSDFTDSTMRLRDRTRVDHEIVRSFGEKVVLVHHLFGYFRPSRLTERGVDIKWVWDHRLSDLEPFLGIGSHTPA
jgi:XamI restriction endonuclease